MSLPCVFTAARVSLLPPPIPRLVYFVFFATIFMDLLLPLETRKSSQANYPTRIFTPSCCVLTPPLPGLRRCARALEQAS